jgi:hypothetical protein
MNTKQLALSSLLAAAGSLLLLCGTASADGKLATAPKHKMALNGTATRTVFGFEVYQVGLYVTKTSKNEKMIYADPGKKRIQIKMLRDVKGKKFESTVRKNIEENFSTAEEQKYHQELERFLDCFVDKTLEKDSVVHIDFLPGKGTRVAHKGKHIDLIEGDEFYHALLRLWIGNPLQESIKQGLLGKS